MTTPSLFRGSGAWRALGCAMLAGLLPAIAVQAQTVDPDTRLTVMTDFRLVYPGLVNLSAPSGPPLLADDGQLYGLSNHPDCSLRGPGIYRTAAAAGSSYTVSQLCTRTDAVPRYDMQTFVGPLVKNSKGQMFGLAYDGNSARADSVVQQGAIFRFTPGSWATPEIVAAAGTVVFPRGGLVMGPDDSVYGMDEGPDDGSRTGRIFKIDAAGRFSVLHSFDPSSEGGPPVSLAIGSDGWLYGTTEYGSIPAYGAIYRMRTDGTGYTTLRAFQANESFPWLPSFSAVRNSASVNKLSPGLLEVGTDWLYGSLSGISDGGSIYRIRKDGSDFSVVHGFSGIGATDPAAPAGPMVLAADGNLYGTTARGGANGDGTLFRIVTARAGQPGSAFELLHSFALAVDGKVPTGLTLGSDGRLYGSTVDGGPPYQYQGARNIIYVPNAYGTVFQVELDATRPGATLSLAASPTSMTVGDIATLTWSSENTGSCTASGAWSGSRAAIGSERITTTAHGNFTYTLTCTDALKGGSVSAAATLNVNPPATVVQPAQSVGNGGGGPLSALLLAALGLPVALRLAVRRRQARRAAATATDHRDECRPEDMGA